MTDDEGHLVALAKLGDNTAFEELYLQNKEKIFHLTFRYTRSRQDAEDLLQETFFRAFFSIRRFDARGGAAFSTWLFRIGINCSINFVKKHKRQMSYRENREPLPGDTMDCEGSNPEETAAFNELVAELEAGLNSLSARQRMIFVLKHHEGLKAREIAQLMKCSEGSVKKQLNRAMAKLVKKLAVHTLTEGKHHEKQMP
jgi:RNA polymerase sigma-70 factor, ECF subfamily